MEGLKTTEESDKGNFRDAKCCESGDDNYQACVTHPWCFCRARLLSSTAVDQPSPSPLHPRGMDGCAWLSLFLLRNSSVQNGKVATRLKSTYTSFTNNIRQLRLHIYHYFTYAPASSSNTAIRCSPQTTHHTEHARQQTRNNQKTPQHTNEPKQ